MISTDISYQVRYNATGGYTPYGGNREFFYAKDHEVIVEGPAETGKTLGACWRIHLSCLKYPGSQWAIVRKVQSSVYGSVLQTFERVIKGGPVVPYGGNRPESYNYANGSKVWIGGMDNPDKVLSSERDGIYVNQAEQLSLNDWETLGTRATGRGAVMPYTILMGDCNPGGSKHWIRERAKAGKLRLIRTSHRDNPTLYDPVTGEITPQGRRTMGILDNLTGVRRKRLREGLWATAEGAVYDLFDVAEHAVSRPFTDFQRWMLALDEGYTNPAVILLVGIDGDGRIHIAREFYQRGVLQSNVVQTVLDWSDEVKQHSTNLLVADGVTDPVQLADLAKTIEIAAVDSAAAGLIADLQDAGVNAVGTKGRVLDGITSVQGLLKVQGDGRPRLTVDPECIETINEFESYTWKPERDEPIKQYDHAMDALRYAVNLIGGPTIITVENPFYDY